MSIGQARFEVLDEIETATQTPIFATQGDGRPKRRHDAGAAIKDVGFVGCDEQVGGEPADRIRDADHLCGPERMQHPAKGVKARPQAFFVGLNIVASSVARTKGSETAAR